MKYLSDSPQISKIEGFGYQLIIPLARGWETPARIIAKNPGAIQNRLQPYVEFAKQLLMRVGSPQDVTVELGEFGLHHIRFSSDRIALDLNRCQHSFISHNFSQIEYALCSLPIAIQFIGDLELFD